jgi:hypothetical protein
MNSLGSVGSTFGFVVSAMDFSYNGAHFTRQDLKMEKGTQQPKSLRLK